MNELLLKFKIAKIRFGQYKVKHRKKVRIFVFLALTGLFFLTRQYQWSAFIYLALIIIFAGEIKR